jgi:hypothetical protein
MEPVVLGMAQPYPGYSCGQVTIVVSRILDTIVACGQTRHNIYIYIYIYIERNIRSQICAESYKIFLFIPNTNC